MAKITTRPPCAVCNEPSVAKKLCDKHYRRFSKHGHVEKTLRPSDWGRRSKHPLYERWKHLSRTRLLCAEWKEFWVFVADVGEAPSELHQLARRDVAKPHNPENTYWREIVLSHRHGSRNAESRNTYARAWRRNNVAKAKGYDLKRKYGITGDDYLSLLEAQKHVCAICGNPDKNFGLAVDHCHGTGQVRGLLCTNCNRGIGHFEDSPDRLSAAIAYLQQHLRRDAA